MAKYNEIMEHIKLSDDMQSRILANVDRQFQKKKRKKLVRIWLPVAGLAVAAAILLLVARPWSARSPIPATEDTTFTETPVITDPGPGSVITGGTESTTDGDSYPGAFQMSEFKTPEELGKAAGFPMMELTSVPFRVSEAGYRLIAGTIAEEEYAGEDGDLSFRKTRGKEDNSGVYEEYPVKKKTTLQGMEIIMQGEAGRFHLINWYDDTFSYSLFSLRGISEEAVQNLILEIAKK